MTKLYDIIGDVHGSHAELVALLDKLGYVPTLTGYAHPGGRTAVYVGDLVDRGPDSPAVVSLVATQVRHGHAHLVLGNHDRKIFRHYLGRAVELRPENLTTVQQIAALSPDVEAVLLADLLSLFGAAPLHLRLDGGKLVVVHGAYDPVLESTTASRGKKEAIALFGKPTGAFGADGFPVRHDWAPEYTGEALVVYGHTVVPDFRFVGNTVNVDLGCAFGGALGAIRYPELATVRVESYQPLVPGRLPVQSSPGFW